MQTRNKNNQQKFESLFNCIKFLGDLLEKSSDRSQYEKLDSRKSPDENAPSKQKGRDVRKKSNITY